MTDRDSILSLTVTGKPLYQAIRDSMTEVAALHGFQFDHTSLGRVFRAARQTQAP